MSRRLVSVVVGIGVMAFALAGCFQNGTHPIGVNQPGGVGQGVYRTIGDVPGGKCTVTRVDSANVSHEYQNLTGGPLYIHVKADDKSVTSTECEPWLLAPLVPPIFLPGRDFVSGDYRVNYEVMAGTYVASGGSNTCHWERVIDFTHDGNGIIESDDVTNPQIATVHIDGATDYGFTSQNCGTWHRTGP